MEIDSFANITPDLITRDIPGDHSGVAINMLLAFAQKAYRITACRCRGDFISMGTGSMFSKHSISGADLTTATSRSGATMVCIFFASTKPAPNGT
jgi:hypothetical protein